MDNRRFGLGGLFYTIDGFPFFIVITKASALVPA
jgi:hypothetical protein